MPTVTVELFSGRSDTQKEFMVKAITDIVGETCGISREGVQVIFEEREKNNWASGPRLTSHREPTGDTQEPAAIVQVGRIRLRPGKHEEYLTWRRDAVFPYMGRHEGFISSTLLTVPDEPDQYVIVNKWRDEESYEAYLRNPRESELRTEAKEYLSELMSEELSGSVVAVFSR